MAFRGIPSCSFCSLEASVAIAGEWDTARSRMWCQAASTSSRRAWVFPVLVVEPWERDAPEDDSVGTNPRYAPMQDPVSQSPTSTANPNAVNVAIPRSTPAGGPPG